MKKASLVHALLLLGPGLLLSACLTNPYIFPGGTDFHEDFPARNQDGTINVVVEIPTGTCDKWEVDDDGALRWEFKEGRPRVVRYLGYPGNYGMIPHTVLPAEDGGDGDPLDVLVLGAPVERGSLVRAHLVGVMTLLDGGEQDDKLLAVRDGTPFEQVRGLAALEADFPGVTAILTTWFSNYKGPGEIEVTGLLDVQQALEVLAQAEQAYAEHRRP